MITDYRKEEGGSLLRRPSDDGAVTQSLNLPPLITRSVDQFIQNNLGDTEFAAVPPRKGSVDAKSCPADLSAARRRSSVVFAFSVNREFSGRTNFGKTIELMYVNIRAFRLEADFR